MKFFIPINFFVNQRGGELIIYNLLIALILFAIIDFITGIIRGIIEKTLSSSRGRDFILKKITIFLLVAATYILDMFVLQNHTRDILTMTVLSFYIINEGIGILENASALGLPIPKTLTEIFKNKL